MIAIIVLIIGISVGTGLLAVFTLELISLKKSLKKISIRSKNTPVLEDYNKY